MGGSEVELRALLSACIDCARRAAGEIHAVVDAADDGSSGAEGTGLVVAVENKLAGKGGWDPLTEADIRAQKLIVSLLSHRWPKLAIVGEEDGCDEATACKDFAKEQLEESILDISIVSEEQIPEHLRRVDLERLCLFVDPLDGTKEFTKGNYDAVQTLIGIAFDGRPVAGVMHVPFHATKDTAERGYLGSTVYGIVGGGCHGLEDFEPVNRPDGLVVTTSASRGSATLAGILQALKPCSFLRCGGAGNKFMHVLRGAADVYVFPDPYTSLWDTCAGEACLLAKYPGGKVTDCAKGDLLQYRKGLDTNNKHGILATIEDHDKYLRIAQDVASKL